MHPQSIEEECLGAKTVPTVPGRQHPGRAHILTDTE